MLLALAARQLGFCLSLIFTPFVAMFEVAMFYTWSGIRRRAAPLELWVITGIGIGALVGAIFTAPLPLMGIIIGATAGGVTGLIHWLLDDVF